MSPRKPFVMISHARLLALVAMVLIGLTAPAAAQTVIPADPPPAPKQDSVPAPAAPAGQTRPDTTRPAYTPSGITPAAAPVTPPAQPARPVVPAPQPAAPTPAAAQLPRGICADAPDVLAIVFASDLAPAARDEAIASVSGKRLQGAVEDEVQYVGVPAGGNEFRLRVLADKLIRLRGINEVGPVNCPSEPAAPKADSASS